MRESLRTIILQELRARFPGINWSLGSLIRELVVEPLASLGELLDSYVQKAESSMNITAICQAPAEHSEELDTWIERLGITLPEDGYSSGYVQLLAEYPEYMIIPRGTVFTWGDDLWLEVTEETEWGGSSGRQYTRRSAGAYVAEVPVKMQTAVSATITAGSPVNWAEAPEHIYDIYTSSPIVGGYSGTSPQLKANLIQAALTPHAFTGEDCMAAALRKKFPADIVDAKVGTRDSDNVSAVSLFLKPSKAPGVFTSTVPAYEDTTGNTVVRISGSGVMSVLAVTDTNGVPCSILTQDVHGTLGDSDSVVRLTVAGVRSGDAVIVRLKGFHIYTECADWLNAGTQGLPFTYRLKLPAIAEIGVMLNISDEITGNVKTTIQNYINHKPLDAEITDSELSALLSEQGVTTTGAHAYTSALMHGTNSSAISATVGGISPSESFWAQGKPVAMYSYYNKITSNV